MSLGSFGYNLFLLKTENWKHYSKIIFKCVNSAVKPIFNKKVAEKWNLWVPWTVHKTHGCDEKGLKSQIHTATVHEKFHELWNLSPRWFQATLRATTSVHSKFLSILYEKTYFFYFTHPLLQNTHISLSILHIYSIKYSLFYNFLLFTLSLPLSLIEPQSHHYQRSLRTQPPSSPPNPHHQEKPTHSIQNPFNPKPINHPPNPKPSQAKSSPTQSTARSSKPTNELEKTSRSRSKPTDQNIQLTHQNPSHHQPDQYPRINTHQNPHITSLRAPP